MRIDISTYDITGRDFVELARAADEAGFGALWLGEHIVLPVGYGSAHPTAGVTSHQSHRGAIVQPDTNLLDPMVALSAAATVTKRIRLATAIYIAPLRHPLVTARATATLHDISQGRLSLGLGSGWLEEEFSALDVPFGDRGTRLDECIDILRRSWSGETFSFSGACYQFGEVQVCPTPVDIPLILGGNSGRALRRSAAVADGWFASGTPSLDDSIALRQRVLELRSENREPGDFPISVRVPRGRTADIPRYESEGFDSAVIWSDELWPADGDISEKRERFAAAAHELGVEPARRGRNDR